MTEPSPPLVALSTKLCPWLEPAWAQLEAAHESGRLGHAWLIAGPEGTGKINLALAFAARLLQRGTSGIPTELGAAEAVRAMRERHAPADHHPDLHWLFPEEEKRTIAVEQVREVIDDLTLTAHAGVAKVVVVEPADAMTTAAANALLKTLEEPAENTYLLLVCHRPGRLPATIRSRCQRLAVARPTAEALAAWLGHPPPPVLARALLLSGGAPLPAAALSTDRESIQNNILCDSLTSILQDEIPVQAAVEHWGGADSGLALTWLMRRLHGEIRARLGADGSTSVTDPEAVTLHNALAELTVKTLFEQYDRAEQLLNQLGSGINAELALQGLLVGFQGQRNRGRS
jgi:DNA polymerase-3 subunit delta'